jgi:cytochrome c-type biogenesis protein
MEPNLNIPIAFLAGILSFVSPCVLPLIPSFLSLLTGQSLEDLQSTGGTNQKKRVMFHALAFIAGFTLMFMAFGLTASALGGAFGQYRDWVAKIGGAIVILLGLNMLGVFRIGFLARDTRPQVVRANRNYLTSFLVGLGFAAGWSPCIGPILGAILALATGEQLAQAGVLLFAYSMGLAVPFLLTAAAITQALGALNRIKRFLPTIERVSGAVLIATGVVLVTGAFGQVAGFFYQYVKPPSL